MARFFPDRPPGTRAVMARTKSRPIRLSAADRQMLTGLTRTGSHPAQQVRRARILLALDENDPDRDGPVPAQAVIAERAGVCTDTIVKVSKAYADRGGDVQATVTRKKRETPPVPPIVTGEVEARVIALACTEPPEGRDRWSLRLLEKHVALTEELPDLDHSTIGRVLKNETAPSSEAVLDDPGEGERGVRRQNGGRPRRLRQALRSCSSGGVHGREALPAPSPTLATRSRPHRDGTAGKTPSTSVTAPARSSSGSNRWPAADGLMPGSGGPGWTGPTRSITCSPSTIPMPSRLSWSWTTSTRTLSAPCMRRSSRSRRAASPPGWRSTTPRNTAPGSTSPRSSWPPWPDNASTGGSTTSTSSTTS